MPKDAKFVLMSNLEFFITWKKVNKEIILA